MRPAPETFYFSYAASEARLAPAWRAGLSAEHDLLSHAEIEAKRNARTHTTQHTRPEGRRPPKTRGRERRERKRLGPKWIRQGTLYFAISNRR